MSHPTWMKASDGLGAVIPGRGHKKPKNNYQPKEPMVKTCKFCENEFEPHSSRQITCGWASCQQARLRERQKEKMIFNSAKFKQAATSEKPSKFGGYGPRAPFISPQDLEDGDYLLRFLPADDKKCPDGFRRMSTHKAEPTPAAKKVRFDCTLELAEDESVISPCAGHETLMKIEALYDQLNDDYKEVGKDLSPWVRFLFPAVITAEEIPRDETTYVPPKPGEWDDNPKFKSSMSKGKDGELVCIFQIFSSTRSLIDTVVTLFEDNPQISDPQNGYYMRFRKAGNKYSLTPVPKPSPLRMDGDLWKKSYPNLDALGKSTKMSYDKQAALLESCWWYKKLAPKFADLDKLMDDGMVDLGDLLAEEETEPWK